MQFSLPGEVSITFTENAPNLLTVILHRCGIELTFETVMGTYKNQALDPHVKLDTHVNRERFRDEWFK
ncbi:hypothetical protein [Methanosarcina sp. 1.H.T.1A.1]|uniref:hypothetical protein n=1 Tax=Methanosarcina sp. 1.H.T.1A.1 TaxID=1483602 RepID=UPI00064FCAB3|nr:hypothetical protein [Methanosarcina sp. 1.H.T.1A.1]